MFSPFLQGIVKFTALKDMLASIVPGFSNTVLPIRNGGPISQTDINITIKLTMLLNHELIFNLKVL